LNIAKDAARTGVEVAKDTLLKGSAKKYKEFDKEKRSYELSMRKK
jgi:hypothetical protein